MFRKRSINLTIYTKIYKSINFSFNQFFDASIGIWKMFDNIN